MAHAYFGVLGLIQDLLERLYISSDLGHKKKEVWNTLICLLPPSPDHCRKWIYWNTGKKHQGSKITET